MVDDMLKLTIDMEFPSKKLENSPAYPIPNYSDSDNIWEEIYDLKHNIVWNINKD